MGKTVLIMNAIQKALVVDNVVKFMFNRFEKVESIKCFGKVMGGHFYDKWIGLNQNFGKWWCELDCEHRNIFLEYVCDRYQYREEERKIAKRLEGILFTHCDAVISKSWNVERNIDLFNVKVYEFGFDRSKSESGEYSETSVILHNGELFILRDWEVGQAEDVSFIAENDWLWNGRNTEKMDGIPYIL